MDAVQTMDEISASSRKIGDIIDSIAFQANILALNAAVEAVRAGGPVLEPAPTNVSNRI